MVAVLNFFADHPGQAFTLTDLVRALKLSRATCHGLLAGLVEAGYLYRSSDKSYLLGPALVAIGEVAKAHYSPLQAAKPEMRVLADRYDATCSASFREHGDVVVRDRAAAASHLGYSVPRGTRLPLAPQFASLFFVWSPAAEIAAWIKELDIAPTDAQRAALHRGAEFIRSNGFLVGIRNISQALDERSHDWLHVPEYANAPILPLFELDPDQSYHVTFVQAPVFDARRRVVFVLGLQGFDGPKAGSEIREMGERVRQVCDRVATFITHGRTPRG